MVPDAGMPKPEIEAMEPPVDPNAKLEILFPFAEQRLLIPKAPGYTVRTKIVGWPLGKTGKGVVIALDQHRPRRLASDSGFPLGSLVDEGAKLVPGPHSLVLSAVDAESRVVRGNAGSLAPFAAVRFWVGDRALEQLPVPRVTLISPAGTYNGDAAADELSIDFIATPERLGPGGAQIRVRGLGLLLERRIDTWQPLRVRHAPSGDLEVEVVLLDAKVTAIEGGRAARTVTVNRELRPPAGQKP